MANPVWVLSLLPSIRAAERSSELGSEADIDRSWDYTNDSKTPINHEASPDMEAIIRPKTLLCDHNVRRRPQEEPDSGREGKHPPSIDSIFSDRFRKTSIIRLADKQIRDNGLSSPFHT